VSPVRFEAIHPVTLARHLWELFQR